MLKPTLLAAALALASAPAFARHVDLCDVESAYDLKITSEALAFSKSAGTARDVRLQAGRIYIDGRELALTAADRERVARIESEIRALVPEVQAIAQEAVGIAFAAIVQVARSLSDNDSQFARTRDRLNEARHAIDQRIDVQFDTQPWNDTAFEKVIEDTVKSTIPVLVGDVTAKAVRIALSGDEKAAEELERRANDLERTLEREVEKKADALEARANALCPRIVALDKLEGEIAATKLDLLKTY